MSRICLTCKIEKQYLSFEGNRNCCRQCRNKRSTELRKTREVPQNIIEKECLKCKNTLNISNFNKFCGTKDGFNSHCKDCYRIKRTTNKKKHNEFPGIEVNFSKMCIKCNITKDSNEFRVNLKSTDKLAYICNDCQVKSSWTKEKQKISEKKYYENNKEKFREKWKREGKKINRRIRNSLNHRISGALLCDNITKNNKTSEYLGCDIEFLKKWFEFQFTEGMNWDNYCDWHIDHVKPCCLYNFEKNEDIIECFNWKNLQPLWKEENLNKGGKYHETLSVLHKIKIDDFEKKYFSAQVKEGDLLGPP